MLRPSFLLPLLLISAASSSSSSDLPPSHHSTSTYIVSVRHASKPSAFPSHSTWYTSLIIASSSISPPSHRRRLLHVYDTVFHGFAARLSNDEASALAALDGVLAVIPDGVKNLHTTRSPEFLGLGVDPKSRGGAGLWEASDYGSDVIIGMLDTGIWPESRSFSDAGMPEVPSHWRGECDGFAAGVCNRKIIGARYFVAGNEAMFGPLNETLESRSARDTDGHGTHTASTAAGAFVPDAQFFGYAAGVAKGVAPKARIAVYKVCWIAGCCDSDILAGIDRAVADGVDIVSMSLGGTAAPFDVDSIAIGAFGAIAHGVFVAASVGNDGPYPGTATNLAPWIATVGAGTIDRSFPADVLLADGRYFTGVSLYAGPPLSRTFFPLANGADLRRRNASSLASDSVFCSDGSLDPSLTSGKIVLCRRGGGVFRAAMGAEVRRAGGAGMVIMNSESEGDGVVADAHFLPATSISFADAQAIVGYAASFAGTAAASMAFRGTVFNVTPAPRVASFSSRGPNVESAAVLKPDFIAPGVDILAAWTPAMGPTTLEADKRRTEYNIMSGTSMACPHVSGAAALVKARHREWTPAAVRSALMTTARAAAGEIGDEATGREATPMDYGAGQVDPERAADPGLVYEMGEEEYVGYLCRQNYTEWAVKAITRREGGCRNGNGNGDLNYPSFAVVVEEGNREASTFRRRVRNVGGRKGVYRVNVEAPDGVAVEVWPAELVVEAAEEAEYSVSFKAITAEVRATRTAFGWLEWREVVAEGGGGAAAHSVRSPIAVTWLQPPGI